MTALAYDGITRNQAMKIAGKNRAEHLERRHWERFAQEVRLSPAATTRRVSELGTQVQVKVPEVAAQLAAEFPANGKALKIFADEIRSRAAVIAANSRKGPSAREREAIEDEEPNREEA
jgi:serine/threonine-protein kinase HipA